MFYASRFLRLESSPMRGPDVLELQKKLNKLGYRRINLDGVYRQSTAQAVICFQEANRIYVDGIVGPSTWKALNLQVTIDPKIRKAKSANTTHIHIDRDKKRLTLTVKNEVQSYPVAVGRPQNPTPLGDWFITQKALNPGGPFGARWMRLSIPWGSYGIHGTNNPKSIGKAISHGCIRLYNQDVIEIYDLTPIGTPVTITGTGFSGRLLRRGDKGADVKQIQKMLAKLNYYKSSIDGDFGPVTEEAVKAFQKDNQLQPDGIVGPSTYEVLYKKYDIATGDKNP